MHYNEIFHQKFLDLKFNTGTVREVKSKDSSGEVTGINYLYL